MQGYGQRRYIGSSGEHRGMAKIGPKDIIASKALHKLKIKMCFIFWFSMLYNILLKSNYFFTQLEEALVEPNSILSSRQGQLEALLHHNSANRVLNSASICVCGSH